MGLTKYEQETIINFNEKERLASLYTHKVRQTSGNRYGGMTFELPKKWVKIAPPRVLSEAQKKVLEDMNRKNQERRK